MPGRPGHYRLVAVDVDGTLVASDAPPTPRVAAAIRQAVEAGVWVVLASGRAFPSVRAYAQPLGLDGPAICYQGAEVRLGGEGRVLFRKTVARALVEEAAALARGFGLEVSVHRDDAVYMESLPRAETFYRWAFGMAPRVVGSLQEALRGDPVKFLLIGEPAQLNAAEPAFRARFQGRLQVVRSHALFLEGVALGVSKGEALAHVARHLGVAREETVAVGDQDNDVPMMRWAGLGVAMGNAPAAVQAQADVVAPSVREDGLAWVLEGWVLARGSSR